MDVQSPSRSCLSGATETTIRTPSHFAQLLLNEMATVAPSARRLNVRARGKTAVLGIKDEHGWVPLLRLSHPSASGDVMSLDIRQHSGWAPSLQRGTPKLLAEILTGPLHFTWLSWVNEPSSSGTSGHEH
jgi:hypothetical protein